MGFIDETLNFEPALPLVRTLGVNQALQIAVEALDMSTSVELSEISRGIRRHSFSEAIEAGKQLPESYAGPEETSIDVKAETTAATTTTTTVSHGSSVMGTVSDVFQTYGVVIGVAVLVVLAIGALLVVILVPLSFADLEYYQVCG